MKLFKHNVQLARQLSLKEWLFLGEAWWLLFYFHLALRWASYEHLIQINGKNSIKAFDFSRSLSLAMQFHRLVAYASKLHIIPMTCLDRSLALLAMLNKRNIPAQVKIGVQKIQNELYAHAWVEVDGRPVGEAEDIAQKFVVFESAGRLKHRQFI